VVAFGADLLEIYQPNSAISSEIKQSSRIANPHGEAAALQATKEVFGE